MSGYLAAFWAEEFGDLDDLVDSQVSREMVPRRKVRAFIANLDGANPNRSDQND